MSDDHHKNNEKEKNSSPFSPTFHFNEFKVGNLENASVINFGNNYPNNFRGYKRHSQGLGTIEGSHNDIHDLEAYMNQKYVLDAILDHEEDLPDWIKELIMNEASSNDDDTLELYERIKELLNVEDVPAFFKDISGHKESLRKVVESIEKSWHSSDSFQSYYYNILSKLNELPFSEMDTPKIAWTNCKSLADQIEQQSKSLLVITSLMNTLSPEIPYQYAIPKFNSPAQQLMDKGNMLEIIKEAYGLKELSSSLLALKNSEEALACTLHYIILPIGEQGKDSPFFHFMKQQYDSNAIMLEHSFHKEDKDLLLPKLYHYLNQYPTFIYLQYIFVLLCE